MGYPAGVTVTSTGTASRLRPKAARGRTTGRGASGPAAPQICPYLIAEDGAWRSARPSRDHRCGAVEPAAVLALDKQRRLCLVKAHASCSTRVVAAGEGAPAGKPVVAGSGEPGAENGRATPPATGPVTRWSIVRTAPVVLDAGGGPPRPRELRRRPVAQAALGGLMALALAAVILARLPEQDPGPSPAVLAATGEPGRAARAAGTTATPRTSSISQPSIAPRLVAPRKSSGPASATAGDRSPSVSHAAPSSYRVREGDTLYGIASHFGTTVEALQEANGLGDSTTIRDGQELVLP